MKKKEARKQIPITGPSITRLEIEYVKRATRDGWFEKQNKYVEEFEKKFAKYIGSNYAIATSSCHGALHLALATLGIGKGDEVIMPDITWIAPAAAIKYLGATPVFVDIDPYTWCIDPKKIELAITKKTKAIIPITMYGHPPEMDSIMNIAKNHKLYVLEDAAQSVGSMYKGKRPGSFGDFGAYSFHATKIITTIEGGMLTTNNKGLYERALLLSNQGKDSKKLFWNIALGYKYKMTNIQAALGLAQLERVEELIAKKRCIFNWYKERIGGMKEITINTELPYCVNSYWMITVIIDKRLGIKKEQVMRILKTRGIISRPFFYPLSSMPPLKTKVYNPVAYRISPRGVHLPCGPDITKKEIEYVCASLLNILNIHN